MFTRSAQFLAILSLGIIVGCSNKSSQNSSSNSSSKNQSNNKPKEKLNVHADPHDIPLTEAELATLAKETATWDAAMKHVQKYSTTIKTETTGGTPAKAHRSLDLLEDVLKRLPEIAIKSKIPKSDWQSIGENSQKLRDLFEKVHANIDAGKAPDYEAVGPKIDEALAVLVAIIPGE